MTIKLYRLKSCIKCQKSEKKTALELNRGLTGRQRPCNPKLEQLILISMT